MIEHYCICARLPPSPAHPLISSICSSAHPSSSRARPDQPTTSSASAMSAYSASSVTNASTAIPANLLPAYLLQPPTYPPAILLLACLYRLCPPTHPSRPPTHLFYLPPPLPQNAPVFPATWLLHSPYPAPSLACLHLPPARLSISSCPFSARIATPAALAVFCVSVGLPTGAS